MRTFNGTVHKFIFKNEERFVVDPDTIPYRVADALCSKGTYHVKSRNTVYFDLLRQGWRDMKRGVLVASYPDRTIAFDTDTNNVFWS